MGIAIAENNTSAGPGLTGLVLPGAANIKILVAGLPVVAVGDKHQSTTSGGTVTVAPFTSGTQKILANGMPIITDAFMAPDGTPITPTQPPTISIG